MGSKLGLSCFPPRVTAEPGTLTPHLPPSNMVIKNISPINYSNQQTFRILPLRDSVDYHTIRQYNPFNFNRLHTSIYLCFDRGLDYSVKFL